MNDQKGIVGELKLLAELIHRCDHLGIHHNRALSAWTGGNRDFSRAGTCIEVKAAGGIERIHRVSNIDQLSKGPGEKSLFVYSTSTQIDYSHHKRLPEHVDDVLSILGRPFHGMFQLDYKVTEGQALDMIMLTDMNIYSNRHLIQHLHQKYMPSNFHWSLLQEPVLIAKAGCIGMKPPHICSSKCYRNQVQVGLSRDSSCYWCKFRDAVLDSLL